MMRPDVCGECKLCDYSVEPSWGECMITDEKLWNIFEEISPNCPLPKDKSLSDEEVTLLLLNSSHHAI